MSEAMLKVQMREFIESLTIFELRILFLQHEMGLSQKNIAEVLLKSTKTIARTQNKVRLKLYKYVDSEMNE